MNIEYSEEYSYISSDNTSSVGKYDLKVDFTMKDTLKIKIISMFKDIN